jgi:hypothetical protein
MESGLAQGGWHDTVPSRISFSFTVLRGHGAWEAQPYFMSMEGQPDKR